jgi:hydroxymethylglutaryl-CoA reductase
MNGVDAVAMATGQDWRGIEAGAQAYAARAGHYAPLTEWRVHRDALLGSIELPLAVGIVGGGTGAPGARAGLELVAVGSAQELATVLAAVGLGSNLAALKALAGEGIQKGHMRLHRRRVDDASSADDTAARAGGEP